MDQQDDPTLPTPEYARAVFECLTSGLPAGEAHTLLQKHAQLVAAGETHKFTADMTALGIRFEVLEEKIDEEAEDRPQEATLVCNSITQGLYNEMKRRFPWLGTDDDAGSGADAISQLAAWFEELEQEGAK